MVNAEDTVVFLSVQKSRQSAYENEEEISVRNNNNSGRSHNKNSTSLPIFSSQVVLKIATDNYLALKVIFL